MNKREELMAEALLEYVERYGLTEKCRAVFKVLAEELAPIVSNRAQAPSDGTSKAE